MEEHFHTGILQLTVTAVGVLVVFQVIRFTAQRLAEHQSTATLGKALGATVTFS